MLTRFIGIKILLLIYIYIMNEIIGNIMTQLEQWMEFKLN